MYCSFFGFQERPFTLTPNPAFIFLSRAHQEAFAHLIYGIENRCGFILLTGEVGAGKTTVIRTLLTELKPETHATALILNPMVSSLGLLRTINREFGISEHGAEPADLVEELHRFLLAQKEAGRTAVLVIDEAQDMEPEVLEQVRLISNLETASEKLIQIILVGQPELEELLMRPDLRQLNQRITVRFHLTSMELADTGEYLQHRITTAAGGARNAVVFSAGAVKALHRFAAGLPRLINAAADRALLIAYNRNTRQIDTTIAIQAIKDASHSCKERRLPIRTAVAWTIGIILAVAVFVLASIYLPRHSAFTPPASRAEQVGQRLLTLSNVASTDHLQTLRNDLATAWHIAPVPATAAATVEGAMQSLGLSVYRYTGNLGGILKLGYPALLECSLPPNNTKRHLLLTGIAQEQVILATGNGEPLRIPLQRFEQLWAGKAIIPWRNFGGLPTPLGLNATQAQREQLAQLLATAGTLLDKTSGKPETQLRSAVMAFQSRQGIPPTGVVGAQTLMQLYRSSNPSQIPTLARSEQNP